MFVGEGPYSCFLELEMFNRVDRAYAEFQTNYFQPRWLLFVINVQYPFSPLMNEDYLGMGWLELNKTSIQKFSIRHATA